MPSFNAKTSTSHAIDITLYDRYAPIIFNYIHRRVPNQQDAEDLLLEVFTAALQNDRIAALRSEEQIAWLQRVSHNKIVDRYRRSTRYTLLPLEEALDTLDEQLSPEQHAVQRENYTRLYQALEQLTTAEQQVVRLRFGNQLRFSEIATLLHKPEGTVRKMLLRTLRRLRTIFEYHDQSLPEKRR